MVGITYTGVDGKETRFASESAGEAISRLHGIRGYSGGFMDAAAAGMASAFASKHKNITRVAQLSKRTRTQFGNTAAGEVYASPGGGVAVKLPSLAGLEFRNGRLVSTTQDKYVSETGGIVATGNRREKDLGSIRDIVREEIASALGDSKEV